MKPARRIDPEPEYLSIRDRVPETLMRRMEALQTEAASPSAGFPLGRMKMRGDLGGREAQARFEACNWYFGLYCRYQKIVGSKTISPQSFMSGGKAEPPDPDSDKGRNMTRQEARIMREYESARISALACGVDAFAAFVAVVIEEQEPDWRLKSAVVSVADALRRHRNMSRRKSQREKGR